MPCLQCPMLPLAAMVIAVNTRFLLKDRMEGYGYFIKEVFGLLARAHANHQFYFLFDRPFDFDFIPPNVKTLVIPPAARHPLLWRFWYDVKLPLVLKKIRADVFVSPDGFCSLTTSVPQCMVVHDLGFLHQPGAYQKGHVRFYRKFTPRFLKKARTIATVSAFSKKDLVQQYNITPDKIRVVYSAAKESFRPIAFEEQEAIRSRYTGGLNYFIYVGAIQPRKNLVNLLKAFSIFKKRQQSGMKLVLAGRLAWKNDDFMESLQNYKYRNDVVLTNYVEEEELVRLVASAYALVYPSYFEGFGVPVLEAMRCRVPVLTSLGTSMEEIAADAGLFFDPSKHEDIAEKMMRIYKDEEQRKKLIEKGTEVARAYTWERTAHLMWESILQAAAARRE